MTYARPSQSMAAAKFLRKVREHAYTDQSYMPTDGSGPYCQDVDADKAHVRTQAVHITTGSKGSSCSSKTLSDEKAGSLEDEK